MSKSKLIKNAWIVTNDEVLGDIKGGSILIEGNSILALGAHVNSPSDAEVIDGTGMIAIPGFVDAHKHLWQGALRGVCGDMSLLGYFQARQQFIAAYRPEDARVGTYASAIDMISGGTTAVLDHAHCVVTPAHADAALEGALSAGIRGVWAYGYCPVYENGAFASHLDRISDAKRMNAEYFSSSHPMLRMGIAITEQNLLPLELTELEIRSAMEMNVKWTGHTHCGNGPAPITRGVHKLYAKELINSLAVLSHCNEFSYNDFCAMREAGAYFASSPDTELYMGIAKPVNYVDAIAAGIEVSLGTDTVACMSGDMFPTMRMALLFARFQINGPIVAGCQVLTEQRLSARDVFRWATINGAKALGIDHLVGSLVPGKRADIVLINGRHLNLSPVNDPVVDLILNGHAANVDTVLIDGVIRKRAGNLMNVDLDRLANDLDCSRGNLMDHAPTSETRRDVTQEVEPWAHRVADVRP
jgi:5-methylthioadenosine/S-adenosylhomocysteine deaminase